MQHHGKRDLCVTGKIACREKVHVRPSVGVDQKNFLNGGDASEVRSSEVDSPSRLTLGCSEPLRDRDPLFSLENPDFVKFYIRFVNDPLLGTE